MGSLSLHTDIKMKYIEAHVYAHSDVKRPYLSFSIN